MSVNGPSSSLTEYTAMICSISAANASSIVASGANLISAGVSIAAACIISSLMSPSLPAPVPIIDTPGLLRTLRYRDRDTCPQNVDIPPLFKLLAQSTMSHGPNKAGSVVRRDVRRER